MTLLEIMVVIGMLAVFLGLAYEPLIKVLIYPRDSQRAFNDRNAVVIAERSLVENFKKTEKGYVWARSSDRVTTILMGQSEDYRASGESPITNYVLYRYDPVAQTLTRWDLTPEVVKATAHTPRPNTELPQRDWAALAGRKERSLVAKNLTEFRFELGGEDQPMTLDIRASSHPEATAPDGSPTVGVPSKTVHRLISKGGYDR